MKSRWMLMWMAVFTMALGTMTLVGCTSSDDAAPDKSDKAEQGDVDDDADEHADHDHAAMDDDEDDAEDADDEHGDHDQDAMDEGEEMDGPAIPEPAPPIGNEATDHDDAHAEEHAADAHDGPAHDPEGDDAAPGVFTADLDIPFVFDPVFEPKLAVTLDDIYPTPDGMTLKADGNIILAVPVVLQEEGDADLLVITKDDQIEHFFTLPAHPETKKACPLGIAFGSDGNLYIADSQGIGGNDYHKSGVLKLIHEDGKPVKVERVVDGMVFSNGLACHGDKVYVCETNLVSGDGESPITSGVYCFDLAELDGENPIVVKPWSEDGGDEHLIFSFETNNPDWTVGANGLGFAPDGTMYVCNFGEASLIAVTLDEDGKTVKDHKVVAKGGPMKSTDGLKVCPETGLVYIADFVGAAVHEVNPETGEVRVLAKSEQPNTGEGGLLDKCSEVCLRDGKLYVANIDLPFDGNENDRPYTISVIELK